jgi:hypothetical protein
MKNSLLSFALVSISAITVNADMMYYTFSGSGGGFNDLPQKSVEYVFAVESPPERLVPTPQDGPFSEPYELVSVGFTTNLIGGYFYFPEINTNNDANLVCHENWGGEDNYVCYHDSHTGYYGIDLSGEYRAASGSLSNHFVDIWDNGLLDLQIGHTFWLDEGWINSDGVFEKIEWLGIIGITDISSTNPFGVSEPRSFGLLSLGLLSLGLFGLFSRKKKPGRWFMRKSKQN